MVVFNLYACWSISFMFYETSRNHKVRHEDTSMIV